jgi:hypothetical protein
VADLFADAAAWFDHQRRQYFSRWITLRGQDGMVVEMLASIGQTESRDFVVTRSDLPRLPKPGDIVVENQGERVATYEVSAPRGHAVWSAADSYGRAISIHTALVGAE